MSVLLPSLHLQHISYCDNHRINHHPPARPPSEQPPFPPPTKTAENKKQAWTIRTRAWRVKYARRNTSAYPAGASRSARAARWRLLQAAGEGDGKPCLAMQCAANFGIFFRTDAFTFSHKLLSFFFFVSVPHPGHWKTLLRTVLCTVSSIASITTDFFFDTVCSTPLDYEI